MWSYHSIQLSIHIHKLTTFIPWLPTLQWINANAYIYSSSVPVHIILVLNKFLEYDCYTAACVDVQKQHVSDAVGNINWSHFGIIASLTFLQLSAGWILTKGAIWLLKYSVLQRWDHHLIQQFRYKWLQLATVFGYWLGHYISSNIARTLRHNADKSLTFLSQALVFVLTPRWLLASYIVIFSVGISIHTSNGYSVGVGHTFTPWIKWALVKELVGFILERLSLWCWCT